MLADGRQNQLRFQDSASGVSTLDCYLPYLPSDNPEGSPFSHPIGAFQGRAEAFSSPLSVVAQEVRPRLAMASSSKQKAFNLKWRTFRKKQDGPE